MTRGLVCREPVMPVRARFVLVVLDLKPVLRRVAGRSAGGKADTSRLTWG
jgi:hypothetical protein